MYILSQDQDSIYQVGTLYIKECTKDKALLGFNICGCTNDGEILLGTYDEEEDAESIVQEIFMLMSNGKVQYYKMPEPAMGLEELEG